MRAQFSHEPFGIALDGYSCVIVKRLEDLVAFQLAVHFKLNVYQLVRRSLEANRDLQFRRQLFGAAASVEMNIAEGWGRGPERTAELLSFLRYARGSLHEANRHVLDGISRGYFAQQDCEKALVYANRCAGALTNLCKSLEPFVKSKPGHHKPKTRF